MALPGWAGRAGEGESTAVPSGDPALASAIAIAHIEMLKMPAFSLRFGVLKTLLMCRRTWPAIPAETLRWTDIRTGRQDFLPQSP
jgi:hypothetical protein